MVQYLHNFYLNKEEPNKGCLLALRSIILEQDANITETQKWGMPCFCYKKRQYLDHVQLEQGHSTRMKIFRVDPNADLPINTLEDILNIIGSKGNYIQLLP